MNGRPTTWTRWREAASIVTTPQHVKRTVSIALLVGSAFFAMNQLSLILAGRADTVVWVKAALTYLTPLVVSNLGVLSVTHRDVMEEAAS
jgi:hypothetical protein